MQTAQSTIVTHVFPDLDAVMSVWILRRLGGMDGAEVVFVPAGKTLDGLPVDADPNVVHVDTGGGRFDHHQPGAWSPSTCAAKKVAEVFAPEDPALAEMVEYVVQVDNALLDPKVRIAAFEVSSLVLGLNLSHSEDPSTVIKTMSRCFDAWYLLAQERAITKEEFEKRLEFRTPWGLGMALESGVKGANLLAYANGAVLFVYRNPDGAMGVTSYYHTDVDLSETYDKLQIVDPEAEWYLHPTKKLLLCGSSKAPDKRLSRLSLEELINLISADDVLE